MKGSMCRVEFLGFRVQGSEFNIYKIQDLGSSVFSLAFVVQGLCLSVSGWGCGIRCLGFRVEGLSAMT